MYTKTRVAAYCRVSTDMEDQLHSLNSQIKYFTEHISHHEGWELVEVFYDEGITGVSTKKRDGFNRMIAECEKGKIDTILTKEVSRFARNTVDTLNYTRHLKQLKVNVIFTNDGIDTNDKDGELRLTIMASIAQEESRKISERVKWGMKRKMENGFVYGYSHLLGYHINNGVLELIPEEAEIVRRIFHEYVYEGKGGYSIARGLNNDGYRTSKGGAWRQDAIVRVLRNDKYCGDLIQWKQCSTDFLTKKLVVNTGENPDTPIIAVPNHHEGIVSKEVFMEAQRLLDEHGQSAREGRRFSNTYWFSNKVFCGKHMANPFLRCSNRASYGPEKKIGINGREVGCDNKFITENLLITCMKYLLEYIRNEREEIVEQLMSDIHEMQTAAAATDTTELQAQIEKAQQKKHNAIDLMLEGIISKDDLKKQVELYDKEIERLTAQIEACKNIHVIHQNQLDGIREYIEQIKQTESIDTDSTEIYKALLDRAISYDDQSIDFYLTCIPFGFHLTYRKERTPHCNNHTIVIESCTSI